MGERAKPFWIKEEEIVVVFDEKDFEDIAMLSTGESDEAWKYGTD